MMNYSTLFRLFSCGLLLMGSVSPRLSAVEMAKEIIDYKVEGIGIPASLTGEPGDSDRGRKLAIDRKKGNCLACHRAPVPEEDDHGDIAPDLAHVASRLTVPQLRLRLVDSKRINPATMMPSFYRIDDLHRVAKEFQGKPILTAKEVEDLLAYLSTLK
uniref:Sulfur-oxidizing protein SoxX n=1 Tax=Candidatus Kentrum sp. SD TaxID=2126332 RepID=A0A450YIS7_9GAMM|nr:MAG: sulfur-oxidizing protein SoxX [Candidatus Kentron sp. SD]VFK41480.1 MAG: sulfur-oxidizing protein SoxX [Candidatus Kentron sp. SD]VFK78489.1 MAG: sulfur-oxidizing protein SoxX [Candidatus Kentron sp. SD]